MATRYKILTDAEFNAKGDVLSASADNTPLILSVGANGKVLTAASGEATGLKWGDGGIRWEVVATADTLAVGEGFLLNAGAALTVTLPASPAVGDMVGVCDYKSLATTYTLTVARNGENIAGVADNLVIDINGAGFVLVYTSAAEGWSVLDQVGGGQITISNDAYAAGWDGVTTVAPSKNAVYDAMTKENIVGLKITDSPVFVTAKLSGLTDGYIPKHTSDAVGLVNSPIYTDGTNVGIGTANPNYPLEVNKSSADNLVGQFVNSAANGYGITVATVANDATRYSFEAIGNTNRVDFVVKSNGNVGIGTASPNYPLEVNKSSADNLVGQFVNSAADGYGIIVATVANDATRYSFEAIGNANRVDFVVKSNGNVGIGTANPNYKLEIVSDSAGKPGTGGLWTVVSDERIKKDIVPANLKRCYEIIKTIPLKRFGWADGVYTEEQVKDRHTLGWIAQDVQKIFPKAVNIKPFKKGKELIEDCLDLNSGQIIAAMYGTIQTLIQKVEKIEEQINSYSGAK